MLTNDVLKRITFIKTGILFLSLCFLGNHRLYAQANDTIHEKENKLIKEIVKAISRDTAGVDRFAVLKRNEEKYIAFSGLIVREVNVISIPFGTAFSDTARHFANTLTKLANSVHRTSRTRTIRNNLFFQENDTINPYLLADNERYLREQSYLRDADFEVAPVDGTDSADITVIVKDVFSFGGSIRSLSTKVTDVEIREDNFHGSGNAGILYVTHDMNRTKKLALGGEINQRNIGGSFINQKLGYQSYYTSLLQAKALLRQENFLYYGINKPLLNRFMKVTYEVNASLHTSVNRYDNSDSLYNSDFRYRYYNFDGWLGYNFNGENFSPADESRRLRFLSGIRVIQKRFTNKPAIFQNKYNWEFTNVSGILGSFTFYRQNFFKTQYVYGFGINEDIPEGLLFTLSAGYTRKEDLSRPFIGFNFQQYKFLKKKNYLDYTIRFEGYLNHRHIEDVNLLGSINYFDRLKSIGQRWRQRFFINTSVSRQINTILNEPLFLNNQFGIPEYGRDYRGGDARITTQVESVFFSPWSLAAFQFAPVISYNLTTFSPYGESARLYSSIGAGIRTRNESIIFGTIQLKGYYFPRGNMRGERFGIDFSTNLTIKYNSQFLKKPDFIEVN